MTSCRIHAATTDIETVLARLLPVCHCLSQDISIQESIFRTSHSQTIETSELRVVQDTIRNQTTGVLLGMRKGGNLSTKATIQSVHNLDVGDNVEEFLELIGFRFDYGFKKIGIEGVAFSNKQFKIHVRVFRLFTLEGASVDDAWTIELETLCESRHASLAVDELYAWAKQLHPILKFGTISTPLYQQARLELAAFRASQRELVTSAQ